VINTIIKVCTKYLERTKVGLQTCLGKMPFEFQFEALVRFGAWRMHKGYSKQRKRHVKKGTGQLEKWFKW
jgi:hypothetical protein